MEGFFSKLTEFSSILCLCLFPSKFFFHVFIISTIPLSSPACILHVCSAHTKGVCWLCYFLIKVLLPLWSLLVPVQVFAPGDDDFYPSNQLTGRINMSSFLFVVHCCLSQCCESEGVARHRKEKQDACFSISSAYSSGLDLTQWSIPL